MRIPDPNNQRLHEIKAARRLTNVQIGRLLGLPVFQDKRKKRPGTFYCPRVTAYLAAPQTGTYKPMPGNLLELLLLKLEKMDIDSKK